MIRRGLILLLLSVLSAWPSVEAANDGKTLALAAGHWELLA